MKHALSVLMMVLLLTGQVWAGGARVFVRPGGISGGSAVLRNSELSGRRKGAFSHDRHHTHRHRHTHFRAPVIIVTPLYYPYFLPPTAVVNAPFYCLLHQVGYVTRIAMIDHLSGAHDFPIETAASLCPEGAESCIFPAY